MKPRYFFTGDHHFWHKNIILPEYENRGFLDQNGAPDVEAMNEHLITSWNNNITDDDIVCHVGDLSFGGYRKTRQVLERLSGKMIFVHGEHDSSSVLKAIRESGKLLMDIAPVHEIEIENQFVILSHHPYRVWARSHHGSWNLHGHCHGSLEEIGKQMDVGIDAISKRGLDYTPVPFEIVRGILDSRSIVNPVTKRK